VKTAIQVKRWANNVPDRIVRELRGSIGPSEQGLIITTSRFTKAAINEAEMTDRAPVTLINGDLLVELLAENEIGVKRRSRPVLQLDETTLAGATGTDVEGSGDAVALGAGKTPPGMYRSLWPLPGGNQAYVTALAKLLPHAANQPTTHDFIGRLQQEFPQVESIATANGYIRVLVALGFVEVESGQMSLTPIGRQFIETHDIELVRDALRERVVGVRELLEALEQGPRTMDELQSVLAESGLAWETKAQLGWRLHWLESVELVVVDDGKFKLIQPSLLAQLPSGID
jgi:hypothetical protein